jgi:DNA-binding protein Fis
MASPFLCTLEVRFSDLDLYGHVNNVTEVLKLAKEKIDGPGGAAEMLGINPSTLRSRLDKLGVSYRRRGR